MMNPRDILAAVAAAVALGLAFIAAWRAERI
jgi:hypothetical protein